MTTPKGILDWPAAEEALLVKQDARFEALLKKYQIGAVGGAADGAKPKLEMNQPAPWLTAIQKDLGAKWDTGPAKGDVLAQDAKGTWGFTPVTTLAHQTVTMGSGALLGPIENPINGVYRGMPLGSVLLGGGLGVAMGTAIDELYPHTQNADGSLKLNTTNLLFKGGLAVAMVTFGTRVFSSTGALIAAAVFGLQVAADVLHKPLQNLVKWIVDTWRKVTGRTGTVAQGNLYNAPAHNYDAPVSQGQDWPSAHSDAGIAFR